MIIEYVDVDTGVVKKSGAGTPGMVIRMTEALMNKAALFMFGDEWEVFSLTQYLRGEEWVCQFNIKCISNDVVRWADLKLAYIAQRLTNGGALDCEETKLLESVRNELDRRYKREGLVRSATEF